ncbi:MAG: ComF family protein [Phycisphaerae bacterium]
MSGGSHIHRLIQPLRRGAGSVFDLLLPRVCVACGGGDPLQRNLCGDCSRRLLSLVSLPYCPRCASTLSPGLSAHDEGCWQCPSPLPRFTAAVRLGPYSGPLRGMIRELKYRRNESAGRRLSELMAEAVTARCEAPPDLVLPVPAHWARRIGRGFDHAGRLAAMLARRLGVLCGNQLVRIRNTPPQVGLSRTRRIENMRGAFGVKDPAAVRGANILLVDDVTTTGATANEAARQLIRNKALRVTLAVAAKSERSELFEAYFDAEQRQSTTDQQDPAEETSTPENPR